jgi:anaerobic ribonucleoside-triphosphate reductase activating protein
VTLYAAPVAFGVHGLGPGRRIVVWVRGCSLHCPGCLTPEYFDRPPEAIVSIEELAGTICHAAPEHDGLTISGGEPFEQADAVAALVRTVRRATDLDVLVYSGFTFEEIDRGTASQRELLCEIDLLMDGRYDRTARRTLPWRGSNNQRLYPLTPRGRAALRRHPPDDRRRLQVDVAADRTVRIVGIQDSRDLAVVQRRLRDQGLTLQRKAPWRG